MCGLGGSAIRRSRRNDTESNVPTPFPHPRFRAASRGLGWPSGTSRTVGSWTSLPTAAPLRAAGLGVLVSDGRTPLGHLYHEVNERCNGGFHEDPFY